MIKSRCECVGFYFLKRTSACLLCDSEGEYCFTAETGMYGYECKAEFEAKKIECEKKSMSGVKNLNEKYDKSR